MGHNLSNFHQISDTSDQENHNIGQQYVNLNGRVGKYSYKYSEKRQINQQKSFVKIRLHTSSILDNKRIFQEIKTTDVINLATEPPVNYQ